MTDLNEGHDNLLEQLEDQQAQVDTLRGEVVGLTDERGRAAAELAAVRREMEGWKAAAKAKDRELEGLKKQVEDLQA